MVVEVSQLSGIVVKAGSGLREPSTLRNKGSSAPLCAHVQYSVGGRHRRRILRNDLEMSRLTGKSTAEIQRDRIAAARSYATARGCTLVLKGQRTLLAFPDGRVWINPTGTPATGTGGVRRRAHRPDRRDALAVPETAR